MKSASTTKKTKEKVTPLDAAIALTAPVPQGMGEFFSATLTVKVNRKDGKGNDALHQKTGRILSLLQEARKGAIDIAGAALANQDRELTAKWGSVPVVLDMLLANMGFSDLTGDPAPPGSAARPKARRKKPPQAVEYIGPFKLSPDSRVADMQRRVLRCKS